ncbi:MAG: MOSC domain-containing protein [Acidobacteriota bacterium]|jgi:MOSC domain-containing protein YiiM|nr:MOSC domain-containing protein [Acidobacteriota bacterium]
MTPAEKQTQPHVLAVCRNSRRGPKPVVAEIRLLPGVGVEQDAHAGTGEREVSLLAWESHQRFQPRTPVQLKPGIFGENITTMGIDFARLQVKDRLQLNDCVLEITRKGKECRTPCAISRNVGECIMPRECVFARVIQGGILRAGDPIHKKS